MGAKARINEIAARARATGPRPREGIDMNTTSTIGWDKRCGTEKIRSTDSSMAEPPAFNREVAGSSPARCISAAEDGSIAQSGKRRLAWNEVVAGSNPGRTMEKHGERRVNWLTLALLFANHFKGF